MSVWVSPMLSPSRSSGSARLYVIEHTEPAEPSPGLHDQRELNVVESPSCHSKVVSIDCSGISTRSQSE